MTALRDSHHFCVGAKSEPGARFRVASFWARRTSRASTSESFRKATGSTCIDPEVALENFGEWVFGYWYACPDRIGKDRTGDPSKPGDKGDPSAGEEFEGMKTALEQLDLKKKRAAARGSPPAAPSPPNVTAFLDDECKLKV